MKAHPTLCLAPRLIVRDPVRNPAWNGVSSTAAQEQEQLFFKPAPHLLPVPRPRPDRVGYQSSCGVLANPPGKRS